MKTKKGQIFNLMDTNGRRNDVINALQGYLMILDDIQNKQKMRWAPMPESLAQYEFYKQAIHLSPEVFERHEWYDRLVEALRKDLDFNEAVSNLDIDWIQKNSLTYEELIKKFDLGIEDRARHYTNNLVKLGLTDKNRIISPVGKLLLDRKRLKKDELEKMLPIDEVNVIYLRQLLKLRVFDVEKERYYSPFHFAVFMLLKRKRMSENDFFELIQGMNPYFDFSNIEEYVKNYVAGSIVSNIGIDIPKDVNTKEKISEQIFRRNFKNRKSTSTIAVYWNYYSLLVEYTDNPQSDTLDSLLTYYEINKTVLNKAFGRGQNIFTQKTGERPNPDDFSLQYQEMFSSNINVYLYRQFRFSKTLDQIKEYSDTTKRIFKATGIIRFDNGIVELAYPKLCSCIFELESVKQKISGEISKECHPYYDCFEEYEDGVNSYYCKSISLIEILEYSTEYVKQIKQKVRKNFSDLSLEDVSICIENDRKREFASFIEKNYPIDKVQQILSLFGNRTNDKKIKEMVSLDATIPTSYEYMVGIAWYYFSGKRIDLLDSYNLTLSANFEPLIHAGGGQGDIVIYEKNKVVMLEATLMNMNNQKRGEWEPVLRHSINLKVAEEIKNTGREVTSFFIADCFDSNTINIWKAVAAVPLQSSTNKGKFTENVIIMPISTAELSSLMTRASEYDETISRVRKLFEADKVKFDINWRDKFMKTIL